MTPLEAQTEIGEFMGGILVFGFLLGCYMVFHDRKYGAEQSLKQYLGMGLTGAGMLGFIGMLAVVSVIAHGGK